MNTNPVVIYKKSGPIAHLIMNRPEKYNAMDKEVYDLMEDAIEDFAADPEMRVIILAGAGGNFTSGGDLKWWKEYRAEAKAKGRRLRYEFGTFKSMARCRKPIIAAVDGWCIASGFNLVLYSDIRIATRGARFQRSPVKLGSVGGDNDSGYPHPLLPNMSLGNALYISMLGVTVGAEDALRMGFISEIVSDGAELEKRALQHATTMASYHPEAVAHHKELCRLAAEVPGSFLGPLQLLTRRSLAPVNIDENTDKFLTKQDQSHGN